MTRRGLWIAGVLIAVLGLSLWANVAPTMDDQYIVTVQSVPVEFELRATDEDVDPATPEGHPLRFVILEGPVHGVLIGDLSDVKYQSPHDGVVTVTYAPAQGFVGTDLVVVTVVDPLDESATGTTTIRIDVQEERAQGLLSGNWSVDTTYDVQSGEFTVFRSSMTEVYRIDHFSLAATATWKMETQGGVKNYVFDALRFKTDIDLWDLAINSTLEFDPDGPGSGGTLFDYWRTSTSYSLLGLHFGHSMYLTIPQTESYQILTVQGSVGSASVGGTVRFAMDDTCSFVFSRSDMYASWRWCDLRVRANMSFTCLGFQQAKLAVSKIPVPLFGGALPGVTLDFSLTFEPEEKGFGASFNWQPIWVDCLKIGAEIGTATHTFGGVGSYESITDIAMYGFKVECELPSGFRAVSATSLHKDYNSRMTGLTDYFEVFRFSGPLSGCCGLPGYISVATYFYESSGWLFDWGMTTLSFDLGLAEQLSLSFKLIAHSGDLTMTPPWTEFSFGWTVRW